MWFCSFMISGLRLRQGSVIAARCLLAATTAAPGGHSCEPPGACRAGLVMGVMAAVLRGGLVREYLVEGHIVRVNAVTRHNRNDRGAHAQVTDQCGHGDVHDIITEAAAVRPSAEIGRASCRER